MTAPLTAEEAMLLAARALAVAVHRYVSVVGWRRARDVLITQAELLEQANAPANSDASER